MVELLGIRPAVVVVDRSHNSVAEVGSSVGEGIDAADLGQETTTY